MFDALTARDVSDALRLLERRLKGTSRRLSPGAEVLRRVAECSLAAPGDHRVVRCGPPADDQGVSELLTLLTLEEVADRLRASVTTVRRLVREEALPTVGVGRSVRVRNSDLVSFIESMPEKGVRR